MCCWSGRAACLAWSTRADVRHAQAARRHERPKSAAAAATAAETKVEMTASRARSSAAHGCNKQQLMADSAGARRAHPPPARPLARAPLPPLPTPQPRRPLAVPQAAARPACSEIRTRRRRRRRCPALAAAPAAGSAASCGAGAPEAAVTSQPQKCGGARMPSRSAGTRPCGRCIEKAPPDAAAWPISSACTRATRAPCVETHPDQERLPLHGDAQAGQHQRCACVAHRAAAQAAGARCVMARSVSRRTQGKRLRTGTPGTLAGG